MNKLNSWGCSSPGRALEWHSRGKGFDPPHLHQKTDTHVSVFIYDEWKHNSVVCNSVAVKPLRAGAHSPVQARSFTITAYSCLRPTLISTKKINGLHVRFLFYVVMRGSRHSREQQSFSQTPMGWRSFACASTLTHYYGT